MDQAELNTAAEQLAKELGTDGIEVINTFLNSISKRSYERGLKDVSRPLAYAQETVTFQLSFRQLEDWARGFIPPSHLQTGAHLMQAVALTKDLTQELTNISRLELDETTTIRLTFATEPREVG